MEAGFWSWIGSVSLRSAEIIVIRTVNDGGRRQREI